MLKRIANLLEDKSFFIAIGLTILIAYLSLTSLQDKIPKLDFGYFDKIAHLSAYSLLTWSWFLSIIKQKVGIARSLLIGILISIYGIVIEVIQGNYTPDREADIYDVLANTIGVILGFVLFFLWKQKRKLIK